MIPKSFCLSKLAQKSIPGGVLALGLLLGVFYAGLDSDGPDCPKTPLNFQYDHV